MATLWVRDGYQAEFERKISSYTSKITDISDQYYKASQIVSDYMNNYLNLPKPKGFFGKLFGKK